jgi:acyl-homoserine lactone acylase PvdQ
MISLRHFTTATFTLAGCVALTTATVSSAQTPTVDTVRARGLTKPVEVLRDGAGISHIYAGNEHDLFFAQGYVAATDRLFQMELWRRQASFSVLASCSATSALDCSSSAATWRRSLRTITRTVRP